MHGLEESGRIENQEARSMGSNYPMLLDNAPQSTITEIENHLNK